MCSYSYSDYTALAFPPSLPSLPFPLHGSTVVAALMSSSTSSCCQARLHIHNIHSTTTSQYFCCYVQDTTAASPTCTIFITFSTSAHSTSPRGCAVPVIFTPYTGHFCFHFLTVIHHRFQTLLPHLFLPHSHCVHSSCVSKLSVWTSRGWSNLRALTWTTHWLENKINERCECTSLAPRPCITPKPQIWAHIVKQVRAYTPTFNKAFMEVVGISMASCMTLVIPWQSLCAVNMKKPSWWPS